MLANLFFHFRYRRLHDEKSSQIHWLDESPIAYCYILIAKSNYIPPLHKEGKVRQNRRRLKTQANGAHSPCDCQKLVLRNTRLLTCAVTLSSAQR